MSPKRILNVDLSCLPKDTEFFYIDFRKQNLFQILGLTEFLYRSGLTGKF